MAEDTINFTVRPLPRGNSLEGAFRVHIATKDLESLKIRPGDICKLVTSEGTIGTGVAWRSTEAATKANIHPIKLTDTFRDAFNFKLGNQVTVARSSSSIDHADKVIVADVSDHETVDEIRDDTGWWLPCACILNKAEAIAVGIAFEAVSKNGHRKRFLIERINSSSRDSTALFSFDGHSQLVIQHDTAGIEQNNQTSSLGISLEGIGGLDQQIDILNRHLERLIGVRNGVPIPSNLRKNPGILLYGTKGTGKSLVLGKIASRPWKKVLHVTYGMLTGSSARIQATVANVVTEALAQQPSLIIVEDIAEVADSKDDPSTKTVAHILVDELARAHNTKVQLIATASSPADVNTKLRSSGILKFELELPIPDQASRGSILKAIHQSHGDGSIEFDRLADVIGERTHGYVGRDLLDLYEKAFEHAAERWLETERMQSNVSQNFDGASTLVNGTHTRASPSVSTISSAELAYAERPVRIDLQREDFERALQEVRPTAMKEIFLDTPAVQWSQIGGSEGVRKHMTRAIEWPLKYRKRMQERGMTPQKGVLLYGPPGCSKTMTAKAIATSSGLNFLAVKGAELTSMYVGESERALRETFRKARSAAPSILFFDEIDAIASARENHPTSGLNVLTTLLNEMDGIENLDGVFVLAATNRPEILDSALLRPGRFDSLLYIGPPDYAARKEIFKINISTMPASSNVVLYELARLSDGFSGAEIASVCAKANMKAFEGEIISSQQWSTLSVDDDIGKVTMSDLEAEIRSTVKNITPAMVETYERWRQGIGRH